MRIGGLASGMDIDSIVSDMMKAERVPLDKLTKKKQILEWQRDDYRAMNTLLFNFRYNELSNMKLTTPYRVRSVASSDDSRITATATGNANPTAYSISQVKQLAKAETIVNGGSIGKVDANKGLYLGKDSFSQKNDADFGWRQGAVINETIDVNESGKTFNLVKAKDANNIKDSTVDLESWSVKVNGKSYEVVVDSALTEPVNDNQVLVGSDGSLVFKNELEKGSKISVDYIGNLKSETVSVSPDSTIQLSQVGLSFPKEVGKDLLFTLKTYNKDTGKTEETQYKAVTTGVGENINIVSTDGKDTIIGTIDATTGELKFSKDAPVVDKNTSHTLEVKYSHQYTTFSMNTNTSSGAQYENFIITGNDTLNNVMQEVNDSKVGVSMFYDTVQNQLTLTRTETGSFGKDGELTGKGEVTDQISFKGAFIENALQFGQGVTKTYAKNANFTINGLETYRSSNTFTIEGVTFNLKQTFNIDGTENNPVSIAVTNDTQKVYDNIKGFVDKYNEIIGTIQGELNEKRYKEYQPLTDEEREGLSDKQEEKWENLAKSGLLRRDPILTNVLSQMRMDFYSTVQNDEISSEYNQLAKIGITTSKNYLDGGKLEISEEKLKKAIEEDPQSVEQLFRGENGIIDKLQKSVEKTLDTLKEKAGNSSSTNPTFAIGRELEEINSKETQMKKRLKQVEDRYWRQFTAMEQAMQKYNSQSAYMMQSFGLG
ncbi:flagellar filament capping protein FliD [Bacillus sp. JJ722]|uniref:flagellar filament capping protein FliD n=1 Tax=Bacillus sp. JJ722 TaxID=3122973 RepID=UPI002FFFFF5B